MISYWVKYDKKKIVFVVYVVIVDFYLFCVFLIFERVLVVVFDDL